MSRRKVDPMPQRALALALRWHIDQARKRDGGDVATIRELARLNPTSFRSSHVRHNLGVTRLAWLAEQGVE